MLNLADIFGMEPLVNRMIDRYETDDLIVGTVSNEYGYYETAVLDSSYHGKWIIVEEYEDLERAKDGHKMWVKKMTENPPDELEDLSTIPLAQMAKQDEKLVYQRNVTGSDSS